MGMPTRLLLSRTMGLLATSSLMVLHPGWRLLVLHHSHLFHILLLLLFPKLRIMPAATD